MAFRVRILNNRVVVMNKRQGFVDLIHNVQNGTYRVQDYKLVFSLVGRANLSVNLKMFASNIDLLISDSGEES